MPKKKWLESTRGEQPALHTSITSDPDYRPRTFREAMAELKAFREAWREQYGEIQPFKRRYEWTKPRTLTNGTKKEYLAAKKAGKTRS